MEPCTQKDTICNIKDDFKELKDQVRLNTVDINALKEGHAETKVYVKQIFEKIEDMKEMLKAKSSDAVNGISQANSTWSKVVIEAIKAIGIIGGIVAGVKLL